MTENLFSVMHMSNDSRRIELADKHFQIILLKIIRAFMDLISTPPLRSGE